MKKKAIMALTAALCILIAGCEKPGGPSAQGVDSSETLAVVNGSKITVEDFKAESATLPPYAKEALGDGKAREKFLENLIDRELLIQEAGKQGMANDPEIVKQVDELRERLMLSKYINDTFLKPSELSEEELKAYFEANKQDLGSVRLSHIVVGSEAEANDVIEKFKAGEAFDKLAKEYSLDTGTKDSGGDLGYVKWDQFGTPSLKEAAFKLTAGEVSPIVMSRSGYHVLRVTDKKPAEDSDFETLKDSLRETVLQGRQEDTYKAKLKELRDKAKISTDQKALASLGGSSPDGPGSSPAQEAPAGGPSTP